MDLADTIKGSLNPEHVHLMITIDTSIVILNELEEKVLTTGQHVDRALSNESISPSLAFVSLNSKLKLSNTTSNMERQ
jgi:hypothetical protein